MNFVNKTMFEERGYMISSTLTSMTNTSHDQCY
jgi:hypothetical protein